MFGRIIDILTTKLVRVNGSSMEPTFPGGSWLVVSRRAYRRPLKPERFDVVRLEDPSHPGRWLVKRIVGLPGEEVMLKGGWLYVDGEPVDELNNLEEGLVPDDRIYEWWPRPNEYVVLGDNRSVSTDSRKFGPVPFNLLSGKVVRRLG